MADGLYSKLARAGWLGSGVKSDQDVEDRQSSGGANAPLYQPYMRDRQSAYGKALKKVSEKVKQASVDEPSGEGA